MVHFFGILTPAPAAKAEHPAKKPFFGPEWRLSPCERDAALLAGKYPEYAVEPDDWAERRASFAAMLATPYL